MITIVFFWARLSLQRMSPDHTVSELSVYLCTTMLLLLVYLSLPHEFFGYKRFTGEKMME